MNRLAELVAIAQKMVNGATVSTLFRLPVSSQRFSSLVLRSSDVIAIYILPAFA